jgi:hypothetical protein
MKFPGQILRGKKLWKSLQKVQLLVCNPKSSTSTMQRTCQVLTSRTISENIYFKSISYLYRKLFMYLCKQLHNWWVFTVLTSRVQCNIGCQ